MKKTAFRVLWGVSILLGLAVFATDARAHDHAGVCGFGEYGLPHSMNYFLPERLHVAGYMPPYFSLHPPVYYSVPVARTYGYSPYAYPPGTRTPDAPQPRSKVIQNKFFVPGKTTGASETDRVAATTSARTIINPYVDQPPTLATGR